MIDCHPFYEWEYTLICMKKRGIAFCEIGAELRRREGREIETLVRWIKSACLFGEQVFIDGEHR